jgi:hypothetical protein
VHRHDFADPGLGDVLSNIPFALAGAGGLALLWTAPARSFTNMQRAMAFLLFGGLLLVAIGSAAYHLAPSDAGLAADRYCTAVAMAGLLGLAAAGHVSERAAAALGMVSLYVGLLAVKIWVLTANVLPWGVFQLGGLALLAWLATLTPLMRALPVKWSLVICACVAGKVLDLNDYPIYELTQHLVSGHTLQHVLAAAAVWPVISALAAVRGWRRQAVEIEPDGRVEMRWVKI